MSQQVERKARPLVDPNSSLEKELRYSAVPHRIKEDLRDLIIETDDYYQLQRVFDLFRWIQGYARTLHQAGIPEKYQHALMLRSLDEDLQVLQEMLDVLKLHEEQLSQQTEEAAPPSAIDDLSQLYRKAARRFHPDLGESQERERRTKIMVELNVAYTSGDREKIVEILERAA